MRNSKPSIRTFAPSLGLALVVGASFPVFDSTAAAQVDPIVYVRCARNDAPLEVTGDVVVGGVTRTVTGEIIGVDVMDALPDVTFFYENFAAPCDLMYREPSGDERVLFDCSTSSTEESACAALDPAVSFDGQTIAFSVFRGTMSHPSFLVTSHLLDPAADTNANVGRHDLPSWSLQSTEAQLYLVDVSSGELTPLPHETGVFDSGPAFLPNGRLAFTSTRDGHRGTLIWTTTGHKLGNRIWTMDPNGRNVDLASHHSLGLQQHPYTLRDGRVVHSSWEVAMGRPFRYTNGSVRGPDTMDNLFHLFTQAPDGAHNFAFYGMHSGDHANSHFGASHTASHFLTQTGDGRVWTGDYYRGNNNALGIIVGIMPEPDGQEGIDPHTTESRADSYAPRDAVNLADWATNADSSARPMPAPAVTHPNYPDPLPFAGKLGHPAALSSDGLMVAWGKGPCFRSVHALQALKESGTNTPGCDVGLYVSPIPSTHPNDLQVIVDTREWHEIMGRAVVPYTEIFGVERPDIVPRADTVTSRPELPTGTPFGLLGAASIVDRETYPQEGIHFAGTHQFHQQGTDTIEYGDDELCGVRILGVMPNRGTVREVYDEMRFNPAGERIGVLGEFSVRNRDSGGAPVMDPNGNPDTSFLVRMPANVPYFMQGIDCEGRTLNTDQTWQHLRPGEMKTCGGCHVHSRPAAVEFEDSFAALETYPVPRIGEGTVPLLTGESAGTVETREVPGYGLFVDFEEDIMPIFARRCVSCHSSDSPDGDLYLDVPGTEGRADGETRSTWYCLVDDAFQGCLPEARRMETYPTTRGFGRPQLTRYIRAYNARASLLYWKARGERTDNRTDATFDASAEPRDRDIDFGAAHPTEITPEELGLLSRWIDLGAAGGMLTHDTQRPTLHLAAVLEGEAVTELRVGTNDLGDGIDVATLVVCVLGADDACDDLSGDAEAHGVVAIPLGSALSDPEQEILARVADRAGNETEVRRTVAWLLNTPPPPPPAADGGTPVDGGGGRDGGPGTTPDDVSGGCGCRIAAPVPVQPGTPLLGLAVALLVLWRRRR